MAPNRFFERTESEPAERQLGGKVVSQSQNTLKCPLSGNSLELTSLLSGENALYVPFKKPVHTTAFNDEQIVSSFGSCSMFVVVVDSSEALSQEVLMPIYISCAKPAAYIL